MKVLCLLGSPRPNGNTGLVLGYMEGLLKDKGVDLKHVHVGGLNIQGCKECFGCKRDDTALCVYKDDAIPVIEDMLSSDVVVWATPTFCWGFPAQLKALMDRMYCLLKWKEGEEGYRCMLEGKTMVLLVTAGGEVKDNADILGRAYKQMTEFMRCKSAGIVYVAPWQESNPLNEQVKSEIEKILNSLLS